MKRFSSNTVPFLTFTTFVCCAAFFLTGLTGLTGMAQDWPAWRGPNRNNVAPGDQKPPTNWDDETNVVWKAEVPGRGHASPTIVGDKIFLATAEQDGQKQSVVCLDKKTGKQLWQTTVNEGGFEPRIHPNNTHASQTIACTDDRVYVVFNNNGGIQLAALDFDGKLLWERVTGPFKGQFPFGFGSSPCIYKDMVIVLSDCTSIGFLAAYDKDGKEVWRTKRGQTTSYATPIVATIEGKDQIVMSGADVRSYDPMTGDELWDVPCPWRATCGTLVWEGDTVFVGGGFPARGSLAVSASTKEILWQVPVPVYEQSLIIKDGYVYAHADSGAAYCWRASDGKEMWKQRVTPKGVSASPVLVGDLIFMTGEKGEGVIVKANPEKFEEVGRNQLGKVAFATPVFLDNRMYARVGTKKGSEPQYLYCIGE